MNKRVLIGFALLALLLVAVCCAMYGLSTVTLVGSGMRIFGGVVIACMTGVTYTLISHHIDEPDWV